MRVRGGVLVASALGALTVCGLAGCAAEARDPWGGEPQENLALAWEFPPDQAERWRGTEAVEVAILEPIPLVLHLYLGPDLESAYAPEVPEGFVGEIRSRGERPLADGTWRCWDVILRPTEPGAGLLPPQEVRIGEQTAQTAPRELRVASRLGDADPTELEDAHGLMPPPTAVWPYWAAAGGVLGLALLIAWWRRRPRVPAPEDGVDLPAHVRAQRALSALRIAPRRSRGEVEVFYVAVSQVLREYIEGRFGVAAPERTTEEFLAEADGHPSLQGEPRAALARFLRACDMVKFAGHVPAAATHEQVLGEAEAFVATTREDRAQPVVQPAEAHR